MKRSQFLEEQIIGILKQQQASLSAAELCHEQGIRDATFYTWRRKCGGMEVTATAERFKGSFRSQKSRLEATV